jgi:hypothetical protein
MQVKPENFLSFFTFNPFQVSPKINNSTVVLACLACTFFVVGISYLIKRVLHSYRFNYSSPDKNQPTEIQTKVIQATSAIVSQTPPIVASTPTIVASTPTIVASTPTIVASTPNNSEMEFFKSITPSTIDSLLNVHIYNCKRIQDNFFSIEKRTSVDEHNNADVIYACRLEQGEGVWIDQRLNVEGARFKCHQNGTYDTYHYFDNFEEFLRYLFKGNFYQGNFFQQNFYIFKKSDNSEIKYKNPFAKG